MKKFYIFLLFSFAIQSFSQNQYAISGSISSEEFPIAYATIRIQNTSTGVAANEEGKYQINVPEGEVTLIVEALGFQRATKKIQVKGPQTVNFTLTESIAQLQEVVVVDKQSGLNRRTPYTVSSMSMKDIKNISAPGGLAASIADIPGVSGAAMGPGIVKPFIRGLGFSRVVTVFQGNKLENHQWGQDHGLGMSDLGVKRVDVIKGPASILYGSGALGGVLLVQDDEPVFGQYGLSGNFSSSFQSVSLGFRNTGRLQYYDEKGWFAGIEGAWDTHADYKDGDNRTIGNSRFNTQTLRAHMGWVKEKFRNNLSFTYFNQGLGIIEDDEMEETRATTRGDRKLQLPLQKIKDYLISYTQETTGEKMNTYFHLSQHWNDRNEIEEDMDEIDLGLRQRHTFYSGRVTLNPTGKWKHSIGLQGSYINNQNKVEAAEILIPDARLFDNGIYYLGTVSLNDWLIQGGVRYDYRKVTADASAEHLVDYGFILPGNPENRKLSRDFKGLTSSLGVTKNFGSHHALKTNLATGFRAPDLAELFSNGPHPGTNRFEVGNAGFKREQNIQMDVNYEYTSQFFTASFAVFNSWIDDYIFFADSGEVRPEDGLEIWQFNQTDAQLYGLEWGVNVKPFQNDRLELAFKGALVRGKQRNNDENLNFIPADNFSTTLNWKPINENNLLVYTTWDFVNDQNRIGINELATPRYNLLHLGATKSYEINTGEISIGLQAMNLLNETYLDHLSILRAFGVTNPGRNFRINVAYKF
jgi:iron complex outermembrane recepter protein